MTLFKATILMCLSMIRPVAFGSDAPNSDLEAAIQSKYAHKAFTLRGFYADGHLHFDSNGSPEGDVHPESWTTAVITIDKTKVSADKVELRGSRFAEVYDRNRAKFIPLRANLGVVIVVDHDANQIGCFDTWGDRPHIPGSKRQPG